MVDGKSSYSGGIGGLPLDSLGWYLGGQRTASGPENLHQGMIQEFRFSTSVWANDSLEDWQETEYANQSSPSTFYTISDESAIVVAVCPLWGNPLYAGQSQQFTATSNGAITWQNPSGLGTLSDNGLYTAPAAIGSQQSISITVVSQADNSQPASASLSLYPPVNVALSPTTGALSAWQSLQYTATVANCMSCNVTWSVSPAIGSVSSTGMYVAPVTIDSAQTVTITASSADDSTKSASAAVTLSPSSSVPIRINAGWSTVVDFVGRTWLADFDLGGDCTISWYTATGSFAPQAGLNPEYDTYRTCTLGGYTIPAPTGDYFVTLKFADPQYS
jgi:hypothetical protein